jgi:hypothetical protein
MQQAAGYTVAATQPGERQRDDEMMKFWNIIQTASMVNSQHHGTVYTHVALGTVEPNTTICTKGNCIKVFVVLVHG